LRWESAFMVHRGFSTANLIAMRLLAGKGEAKSVHPTHICRYMSRCPAIPCCASKYLLPCPTLKSTSSKDVVVDKLGGLVACHRSNHPEEVRLSRHHFPTCHASAILNLECFLGTTISTQHLHVSGCGVLIL
jgi:hypothetical protein